MFALIPRSLKGDPNPPTPNFVEDYQWVHNYLAVHQLSVSSYRYAYIFWVLVGLAAIMGGLARTLGENTTLGVIWTQWSIRRPTRRRKYERLATAPPKRSHGKPSKKSLAKQYSNMPTNSQILFLLILMIVIAALCTLGPDYMPSGTTTHYPIQGATPRSIHWPVFEKRFNETVTAQSPSYTISKAWWTAGGRTGLIAFTLIPLCVLIALKAPPFALFALRFPLQLHSDKLAWVHRWLGRIIYICTLAHVSTWSVQLARDQRGSAGPAWKFMFIYPRFIYAIVAFVCMTLLVALSFPQFRNKNYEYFYFLHVLLVPSTLVFSALHYPPLGWFCWSSLVLWTAERLWRFLRVLWFNGLVLAPSKHSPYPEIVGTGSRRSQAASPASSALPWKTFEDQPSYEMDARVHSPHPSMNTLDGSGNYRDTQSTTLSPPPGYARAELLPGRTIRLTVSTARRMTWAPGQYALLNIPCISRLTSHPFTIASIGEDVKGSSSLDDDEAKAVRGRRELVFFIRAKQGFTLDLWNEVQRLTVRQDSIPLPVDPEFNTLSSRRAPMFRAQVDGPYGSAARARWLAHSTVLIITGGTGVSFGLPILEYLCACLSERSRKFLGGKGPSFVHPEARTTRVRFVWLIREYSHLTWCAIALRRCIAMVRPGAVQVDIFVTNFAPDLPSWRIPRSPYSRYPPDAQNTDVLAPPTPRFAAHPRDASRSPSPDSLDSDSDDSIVDLGYAAGGWRRGQRRGRQPRPRARHEDVDADADMDEEDLGARGRDGNASVQHTVYSDSEDDEEHDISELTNFEGEEDARAPGEIHFSMTLKRKGRHIRRESYHQNRDRPRSSSARPPHPPTPITEEGDKVSDSSVTASVVFGPLFGSSPSHEPSPPSQSMARSVPMPLPPPPPASAVPQDRLHPHRPLVPPIITEQPSQSRARTPPYPSPASAPAFPPHRQYHRQMRHQHTPSGLSLADSLASDHSDVAAGHSGMSPSTSRSFDARSAIDEHTHLRLAPPRIVGAGEGLENLFDLGDAELDDLANIASLARSGRPKLDRILAEEVNRASGALAVACCGPTSLSNVVRKVVSTQIDPSHVYNGDERGAINFISEDFSF